ncbi:MAG: signal recognition particle protein [bacterium]|jgi:signal recognition particle subunit SRP54|nr:signal recognition particle protein [Bacillota bacterium]
MLEGLAAKIQATMRKLRGKGKLSEADVKEALREVRLALLEADVNYKVVKDFTARVRERAVGQEVMQSLTPGQQVIKIVHEELTSLMGGAASKLEPAARPPTVVMLVGLQGSGKTTTCAKLARYLRREGRRPLLVAADVYRPAAIKQLQVLGEELDIPVFSMGDKKDPVDIARGAREHALSHGNDYVLVDTAGRLHVDEELMTELVRIKESLEPQHTLLVVDAMTGQDAVTVAEAFHSKLELDGIVLTKLDGDTRGGAALSVRAVTGCPIKFIGVGEKLDALEPFHPERLASRILGMGDVLTLIERAQESIDIEKAKNLEERLKSRDFNLEDFREQLHEVQKMGPLDQILGMLPGMGGLKKLQGLAVDEKQLDQVEAIINSMTPEERRSPEIIDGSRKRRIARGSGTKVQDVNRLLKQFEQTKRLLRQYSKLEKGIKPAGFPFLK